MKYRLLAVLLLVLAPLAPLAAREAAPATQPTEPPATQPNKYPNAAELMAQQRARQAAEDAKQQVAVFDLNGPIVERPADFSFFGGNEGAPTLRSVVTRMQRAAKDEKIRGVLILFGANTSFGLSKANELRDAVSALRHAGKRVFVYADSYDTATYTVASAATNVCMLPAGELTMPGVGVETMFYRGAMDKVGVTPDFVQVGEYKGAEEPYTRTAPSDELRGEMNKLVDSMYNRIVDGMADARGLSRDTVRRSIDDTMVHGEHARDRGFVDHLLDQDGLRPLMESELGGEVRLIDDYGEQAKPEIDFSNIFALLKAMNQKPAEPKGPAIALVYAEGVISDGDGEASLFGDAGVGSERMREAFRTALKDENVKAVVIRIDSPGGSALASEVMWQAARRVAEKKPVVISIGSMAASGGYYLASAGDYIVADPMAIVGSIGVVGGKFVMKDLFDKVGLTTETFSRGRNADLFSSSKSWDDRQRKLIRQSMQQVYDQFTQRIMTTRSGRIADIDKVARGRIFLAPEALKLGMVDELGGLETAIAHAAEKAGLKPEEAHIKTLPAPRTLADLFAGGGPRVQSGIAGGVNPAMLAAAAQSASPLDAMLLQLPPQVRKSAAQQYRMMRLLERRPVVLMASFTVTVN